MKRIFKYISTLLLFIVLFSSYFNLEKKVLKSVYGYQNDTIVSIKIYDRQSRLIFDRTTQIIGDWNNNLLTWITAKEYEGDKQTFEYYAHSNLGLRITIFDYNQHGVLRDKYSKYFSSSKVKGRNPFAQIYQIENIDSLKSYLKQNIPDSIPFTKHNEMINESTEYFESYIDSTNQQVKEFWTVENTTIKERQLEKYDLHGRLVYKYYKTPTIKRIEHFNYDSNGNLIEEIEIYNPDKNRFQKKEHIYKDNLLRKTFFYHGTSLAFTYEYFYKDTLLIKEIKNRITESIHFKNVKKTQTIEYQYEYY